MKIYDTTKSKIITNYDLTKGWLKPDTILIHEQKAIEEKSHYETFATFDNGGKSVRKIIDIEAQPYIPEHIENIMIYIPYTDEELHSIELKNEISDIKFWYDTYYSQHEQKYRRLHTLGQKCDNGADPYNELIKLYEEAEQKRKRIQKIEELINEMA